MPMHHASPHTPPHAGPDGTMTTVHLQALLKVPVSAAFLKQLGATPAIDSPRACYWRVSDVPQICTLLEMHLAKVRQSFTS